MRKFTLENLLETFNEFWGVWSLYIYDENNNVLYSGTLRYMCSLERFKSYNESLLQADVKQVLHDFDFRAVRVWVHEV